MDTTSKTVSFCFPAGGLTVPITCSVFLRLYPWDCFLTKICHLRKALRFVSEVNSLDNVTRQLLPQTINFSHLSPHRQYPPTPSLSIKDVQNCFYKSHMTYPLSVSPAGIDPPGFNTFAKLPIKIPQDTFSNLVSPSMPPSALTAQRLLLWRLLLSCCPSSALLSPGKALKYLWRNKTC